MMTLPARFSLLHSEMNDFLFASIGDQQNGMPLNVMSGLTRLGLDPWEEAARLTVLPKTLAADALAPIIARLTVGWPERPDNRAISQRLVAFLPTREQMARSHRQQTVGKDWKYFHAAVLLACLALAAAILIW
jgi:hypothetical protein